MSKKRSYVRRYTNMESLRCLLRTKTITLVDPQKWDDKNDSYYLHLYKKEKKLRSLLALCLTRVSERYHLWKVFGPRDDEGSRAVLSPLGCGPYEGNSALTAIGVRIRFDRIRLVRALKDSGVRSGNVKYLTLSEIEKLPQEHRSDPLAEFPFLKRYGFQDEKEFRLIYESKSETVSTKHIPIEMSCISRIVLSPWLDPSQFAQIKNELRSIDECRSLTITHSRLIDSRTWKQAGEEVVKASRKGRPIRN